MKKGFIIGAAVLLCYALGASIYLRTAFDPKPAEGLDYDDPPTRTELLAEINACAQCRDLTAAFQCFDENTRCGVRFFRGL